MVRAQSTFKNDQLKFERVENAYQEKWPDLKKSLKEKGFTDGFSLLINAYKTEGKLEVWLKNSQDKSYRLFRTYDFCAHSGTIGPKLTEGDKQTPEGFYHVNVFNPESSFHLSLGINYPNGVDYVRTGKDKSPGSDIYIHGKCETVGCIPLTDEKIKELYVLAVEARQAGQEKIAVNIYPFKMTDENLKKYTAQFPAQTGFWQTLQPAYLAFEKTKVQPRIEEKNGNYILSAKPF